MNQTVALNWEAANQSFLAAALAEVRAQLTSYLSPAGDPVGAVAAGVNSATGPEPVSQNSALPNTAPKIDPPTDPDINPEMQPPAALETLRLAFGLSDFECKILLMCAGVELDARFASLFRAASARAASTDLPHALASFSLALAAFEDAHWSALLPTHPLRYWRLLEVSQEAGHGLTSSPLRIDERILHYLAGASSIDERLRTLTQPVGPLGLLSLSQHEVAEQVVHRWLNASGQPEWPIVQLCGSDAASRRAVATSACAMLGTNLRVLGGSAVPPAVDDLDLFLRLWQREARLHPIVLLLECDGIEPSDKLADEAIHRLIETLRAPLLVSARERRRPVDRLTVSLDVPRPTSAEQEQVWTEALGSAGAVLNGSVGALTAQFSLSVGGIHAVVAQAFPAGQTQSAASPDEDGRDPLTPAQGSTNDLAAGLWEACRVQARPALQGLAQRIASLATWDDLVLPEKQRQLLGQIATQVRQRAKVYQTWGFASKDARGLGISALFAGPSGTGKTMAGEVLANELRLDLYRIDLSQVVSKYIGETEKNLRRVFDAADEGAAILLFDEADALFGKRSEVKDSHDRYANIEVSYLLQRMEAYRGLAILTTNRRDALDAAFLRRIRFVVEFPFPETPQRAEIWRRVFPAKTPTEGLSMEKLARLNAAGGNIRNIALGAAFLAANAGEPVRMSHLLDAARSEFTKIERPLTNAETAGWI